MRWQSGRRSENVEDLRSAGGLRRTGMRIGGVGLVGSLALAAVVWVLGGDPLAVLRGTIGDEGTGGQPVAVPANDAEAQFVSVVLADTEDTWSALFPTQIGGAYRAPHLVLFRDGVASACGTADSAVGPFYCPSDRRVYLDLSFFGDLDRALGAPGDFAQAYVIAHEVGHHVQTLLGTDARMREARRGLGSSAANALSVRYELQADCLAGVWAHHAHRQRQILEPGDVEEALGAAAAIGDDRLQRQSRGRVVPESFTHGTSAQRVHWFRTGMTRGLVSACETFAPGAI